MVVRLNLLFVLSYLYVLQAPGQDIVPIDGSSSSQPDELVSLVSQGEAEGMDIQQSEASQSSTTDPQSSELERNDGSTSSLSLSSERLEEGGIVALPQPSGGALMASRRTESSSAAVLESRTITILSSSNNSTQQATFLQSLGSELSLAAYEQSSSSPHLESSVDPSSSQLSLDSSNGSSSQGDVSQSEIEAEDGLHFTSGTRTSSDSNLQSQSGMLERTPSASAGRSSSSLGGTSVIVEPSNSRGTPRGSGSSASEGQQQQRPSQPRPPTDDESGNSSRSTG